MRESTVGEYLAYTFLKNAGLKDLALNINSIGCKECRAAYNKALKEYIGANLDNMCPTCKSRFDKNPLRILDCKEEKCKLITAQAPKIIDYLCDDCKEHFHEVQNGLTALGIPFAVNPGIVRGLDYYTRTVFEFISTDIGAQGTVCGGGRYNHLVEEVGGKPTPAAGFGLGLERLLLVLENTGNMKAVEKGIDVYVAPLGDRAAVESQPICQALRMAGLSAETDLMGRSLKAQMKYADKIKASYVAIIGDDELDSGVATVKNMAEGQSKQVSLADLKEGRVW